jgi:hypothetical protein
MTPLMQRKHAQGANKPPLGEPLRLLRLLAEVMARLRQEFYFA